MSVERMSRYIIRHMGEDVVGPHRIWDTRMEAYCGLPDEAGQHEVLEFPNQIRALDWLRLCAVNGTRTDAHPGITMKVYQAKDGATRARHLKTVAEPPGELMVSHRFPQCECPRCLPDA